MKTVVEEFVDDSTNMRLYQQERAIYEVTELIEAAMEGAGVGRAELAKRLGKTKAWVTQLLDGTANKTIRTVADALAVLGREFHSTECPIQISSTAHEGGELKVYWGPGQQRATMITLDSSVALSETRLYK